MLKFPDIDPKGIPYLRWLHELEVAAATMMGCDVARYPDKLRAACRCKKPPYHGDGMNDSYLFRFSRRMGPAFSLYEHWEKGTSENVSYKMVLFRTSSPTKEETRLWYSSIEELGIEDGTEHWTTVYLGRGFTAPEALCEAVLKAGGCCPKFSEVTGPPKPVLEEMEDREIVAQFKAGHCTKEEALEVLVPRLDTHMKDLIEHLENPPEGE